MTATPPVLPADSATSSLKPAKWAYRAAAVSGPLFFYVAMYTEGLPARNLLTMGHQLVGVGIGVLLWLALLLAPLILDTAEGYATATKRIGAISVVVLFTAATSTVFNEETAMIGQVLGMAFLLGVLPALAVMILLQACDERWARRAEKRRSHTTGV